MIALYLLISSFSSFYRSQFAPKNSFCPLLPVSFLLRSLYPFHGWLVLLPSLLVLLVKTATESEGQVLRQEVQE